MSIITKSIKEHDGLKMSRLNVKKYTQIMLLSIGLLSMIPSGACAGDFKVITLGTGVPIPDIERFSSATLVEAGDQRLLFDVGRGAVIRLWQAKIPIGTIDQVFITHHHSDHIVGMADLYLTYISGAAYGKGEPPLRVMGATGVESLMGNLKKAFYGDIQIRYEDGQLTDLEQTAIEAKDIVEGVVYEKGGVRVTAFDNFHGEHIKPSLGYRIDYKAHSVVISGDTKYCENLVDNSKNADLILHSVAMFNKNLPLVPDSAETVLAHHTTPEEAARVFNETKPKLAVLTHMVRIPSNQLFPFSDIVDAVRKNGYCGPLVAAEDLMTFNIEDEVTIIPFEEL